MLSPLYAKKLSYLFPRVLFDYLCKFCWNSLQWWLHLLTASASCSSNKSSVVHLLFCKNMPTKFWRITQSLMHALPVTQRSLEVYSSTLRASMGSRKVLGKRMSRFSSWTCCLHYITNKRRRFRWMDLLPINLFKNVELVHFKDVNQCFLWAVLSHISSIKCFPDFFSLKLNVCMNNYILPFRFSRKCLEMWVNLCNKNKLKERG